MDQTITHSNTVNSESSQHKRTHDLNMTSSTTSVTSSLASPVDSGVQLLDSESEATSVMSVSGTGCDILYPDPESSSKNTKSEEKIYSDVSKNTIDVMLSEKDGMENSELKCQMDLFEKEFGIAGLKEFFLTGKIMSDDIENQNILLNSGEIAETISTKTNCGTITMSNSTPCLRDNDLGFKTILNKSLSDDVFELEHLKQGKLESTTTEADLMNVSLTSYELLDYTSQNIDLPIENDPMNVSMSEEVNENLCSQLLSHFETIEEIIPQEVPVIEPEEKLIEEQIVYRRQRKKKSKSDTPKKRVSFHEDILNSTKIDDIHINHGFITHEPDDVSVSFFQRGFIRKPDVVKGRYSWAAEGDAPYYEKQSSNRKANSDIYVNKTRYSSTSSSSTGSNSSIDEEDSSDENVPKPSPPLTQPKSSCLKKTPSKKIIDTKIVQEEMNIPTQKSESNLLDSNIFGSLKNILKFSTSVPLAERGVPEGQEDISDFSSEKTNRRRSCANLPFINTERMLIKEEPVKKRGNLNIEVAKNRNFRLSRSEGFFPNYPVEQELPSNIILCDSNVYEHKGISYSYEYDNFQKNFEQQNKPKSSASIYQMIMKEFNFFKKKSIKEPEQEWNDGIEVLDSNTKSKPSEDEEESKFSDKIALSVLSGCSSLKLDGSENDGAFSEFSDISNSKHLNSPKRKINRNNHYSVQSSFKSTSETDPFLLRNETISKPSASKSLLIERFLKNVTMKKILDAKSAKKHKNERKCMNLYVNGFAKNFKARDEIDMQLEQEITAGLRTKEADADVYDTKMIFLMKREVFRSQSETLNKLFMVRSAYTTNGDSKPLLAIITNSSLYITSIPINGQYKKHFMLPFSDLNTILIGPNAQTLHLSNFKQDMQCMITTGCSVITNEFIGQLELAYRKDIKNMPNLPAIRQLCMQDMSNLRRAICKQTTVQKHEDYVYYSIVDVKELDEDVALSPQAGTVKEGHLMFKLEESVNSKWETAYFILKSGMLYMMSSVSHRVPMQVYPLVDGACQGARRLYTSPRPHTFQITVGGKHLKMAAPDEYVASDWLQALIHAANGKSPENKIITQSCSLLMTTEHVLTVREAFPCTIRSILCDNNEHEPIKGPQALSCAAISDLVSFRLPSCEQSWCILEFACREVYESGGDWILYFSSNAELEEFISTLEVLWDYNNVEDASFPLSTIPATDPLSKKCVDVYMSLKDSWSPNLVHLQLF